MDSSGEHIFDPLGLSTKRCFDFLLSLPRERIYVAFGLNYDVNMMLRDFGEARLKELWAKGECRWFDYHVQWIPAKWFKIKSLRTDKSVKVNEVFGFYQCSFVKALEKWKITTQDSDNLEQMKKDRSLFADEMRDQIIAYCHTETVLLNQLCEALREALLSVGIKNSSWNGAGSIAAAILREKNVKAHIVHQDDLPKEIRYATLKAYFGGRTELFKQGSFTCCHQYDVVSAYPFAAIDLPTLSDGRWKKVTDYSPDYRWALWDCRWECDGKLSPFPYRFSGTRISYPTNGIGNYHAVEVAAALQACNGIEVLGGWVFEPADTETKPFAFIPELAAEKTRYKREGHAGEKVLKLGINSLYGKLAQGKGYKDTRPPFQSYFWAGYITAHCRATMLRLASQRIDSVVMIATDGIFFDTDPRFPHSDTLGSLEYTRLDNMFTAQPGVYCAVKDGEPVKKSRGFFAKEIDFTQIREGFESEGPYFVGEYESTRFTGLGSALMRREMRGWRSWETGPRRLSLHPSVKRVLDPSGRPVIHLPPTLIDPIVPSSPYKPKQGGYLEDEDDYVSAKEQPLRTE